MLTNARQKQTLESRTARHSTKLWTFPTNIIIPWQRWFTTRIYFL